MMEIADAEMPSFQLPNETWIGIFKHFDMRNLLDLSLVCKHWNHLIFTHLTNRIKLNLDLDQRKYPHRDVGMVPQRYYKHLCLRSFKLDCPDYLFDIVKQIAVNLDTLELHLVSLETPNLVQLLARCTRMRQLIIKVKYFECDDTLLLSAGPPVILPSVRSVSFDAENYVSTFNLYSFEKFILQSIPNVRELKTVVYRQLDLSMTLWMASRLRSLKVTVSCEAINDFLSLRLPVLKELDLTLLQPENQWRKRRTFRARDFQDFLLGCKSLRKAALAFRCEYDQQLLTAIFTSLPRVEFLQLSGGIATERFSLDGLERMKNLKTLLLHCMLLFQEEGCVVPMPSVEKFTMYTYIRAEKFGDVLKRFPNLKSLTCRIHGQELQSIGDVVPLLEELSVDMGRLTPEMITHMQQLVSLTKLTISGHSIARTNFRSLRNVMALPALKCLNVDTHSRIPPNVASLLAASNRACKLTLNGQLVIPAARTRRAGVKRKQPVPIVPVPNKTTPPATNDYSQASGSGASTSGIGSSSFVASASDISNVSFSMVASSLLGGMSFVRVQKSMDVGQSASGVAGASTMEIPNNSENKGIVKIESHVSEE